MRWSATLKKQRHSQQRQEDQKAIREGWFEDVHWGTISMELYAEDFLEPEEYDDFDWNEEWPGEERNYLQEAYDELIGKGWNTTIGVRTQGGLNEPTTLNANEDS